MHFLCWKLVSLDSLGYSLTLVVSNPLCLDPSDGVFGRFDLAALCGCHTLNVCYLLCSLSFAQAAPLTHPKLAPNVE